MNYSKGLVQAVEYASSAANLWFTPTVNGREVTPDAAPNITVYNNAGVIKVAATAMTAATVTTEGLLKYDAQTGEFRIGEVITGETSGATATIRGQSKAGTSGILHIVGVDGTFADNKGLAGSYDGVATADGTIFSLDYFYALDASSTTTYGIGEDYACLVEFDVSAVAYQNWFYWDIVYFPYHPYVTNADLEREHPGWSRHLPEGWPDWQDAIAAGHRELAMRIRRLGKRGHFIVKREELFGIELAFIEYEIAKRSTDMESEEIQRWMVNREAAWSGRGEFAYSASSDDELIDSTPMVISHRLTR